MEKKRCRTSFRSAKGQKGPRLERHNAIMQGISRKLEELGWNVVMIPVTGGYSVLDLVAWLADGRTLVCDATVVSDLACLKTVYDIKVAKYDVPCIHDWLRPLSLPGVPQIGAPAKGHGVCYTMEGSPLQ